MDEPSDTRYWALALDLAPVAVYVAACIDPHLARLPSASKKLFSRAPPTITDGRKIQKLEKAYHARLKKLDSFMTEFLPLATVSFECRFELLPLGFQYPLVL